jgi:hypothetical protein
MESWCHDISADMHRFIIAESSVAQCWSGGQQGRPQGLSMGKEIKINKTKEFPPKAGSWGVSDFALHSQGKFFRYGQLKQVTL